jgi:DNA-binding transcriptional LysR family regulator
VANIAGTDLNLLVAFEALYLEQSVSRAARRVGLGQSAMSSALGRLRALFDDALFVRTGGAMRPTPKAQALAEPITEALRQVRRALEASAGFDPKTSTRAFTLAASDYAAFVLLPPLHDHLRTHAPRIDIRLRTVEKNDMPELLAQGQLDLAFGVFPSPPRGASRADLFEERFVGIARRGHPALKRRRVPLDVFARLPHALMTTRADTTGIIDDQLAEHHERRRVALTIPHSLVVPFVVGASDLVTAVAERVARRLADAANLTIFEIPVALEPWTLHMLWSDASGEDSASLWLRRVLQQIAKRV